jgi:hypothetical protein
MVHRERLDDGEVGVPSSKVSSSRVVLYKADGKEDFR